MLYLKTVRRWRFPIFFLFVALVVTSAVWLHYWREHRYDEFIAAAATRYEVDPELIRAVIWKESRFKASARGKAGEVGLMQVRKPAATEWAVAERLPHFDFDQVARPATNIACGTWYLSKLLKRYRHTDNPIPYALADYNAGRTHVLRWNNGPAATNSAAFMQQITFPGTRKYIEDILEKYSDSRGR